MEEDGDQPLFQGLLRDELDLLLERSLYLLVERLDQVVRVDEPTEFPREPMEGERVLGLLRPRLKLGVFAFPFSDEALEGFPA